MQSMMAENPSGGTLQAWCVVRLNASARLERTVAKARSVPRRRRRRRARTGARGPLGRGRGDSKGRGGGARGWRGRGRRRRGGPGRGKPPRGRTRSRAGPSARGQGGAARLAGYTCGETAESRGPHQALAAPASKEAAGTEAGLLRARQEKLQFIVLKSTRVIAGHALVVEGRCV